MQPRFAATALTGFATGALRRAGMEAAKADAVADVLVEGDLLGHTTHGLQLLPLYLAEIEKGQMTLSGRPEVLADHPAAVTWDGRRLPGPWLTLEASALACERAKTLGTCAVVIRRSHHVGCLASYLKRVTDQGLMILLTCSDPAGAGVAPHGGYRSTYTPNPIAAGWPTDGDPVLLDVSQSITTNLMSAACAPRAGDSRAVGRRQPRPADGRPRGALHGSAGGAAADGRSRPRPQGLRVRVARQALTGGLAGHGRADPKEGWTSTTFLEVFQPALFGGAGDFLRQTSWLARACRESPPRPGFDCVRLPGENGLRRRESQLRDGVELHPDTVPALRPWSEKLGIALPEPLA